MMSTYSPSQIPSVSLLYKTKRLIPPTSKPAEASPAPSQSFNDRIGLIRGDITTLAVDAIVNAANNSLLGGGGVDGAIHRAAGRGLLNECRKLGGCDTGSAKITDAYELPCKKVIHAVGPIYDSRDVEESESHLAGCYTTSLKLAVENECKSIAFSALSTGVYGYPSDDAAPVAIQAVKEFLEGEDGDRLEKVIFCTFVAKDVDAYNDWLPRFFPATESDLPKEPEDEWEEVEGGESAENGPPSTGDETTEKVDDEPVAADKETTEKPESKK